MTFMTSKIRKTIGLLAAGTIAFSLAACGTPANDQASPAESGPTNLRVTVVPGTGGLPLKVAMEEGFLEEQDIEVEVTEGIDYVAWIQALDKQFDMAMVTSTTFLQSASAGMDLKAFAGVEAMSEEALSAVFLTNKPGINSIEDLAREGGTVATPRVNDLITWFMEESVSGSGVSADSLNLVQMPFADMADQLANGNIDAALVAPGFMEPLIEEGYTVLAEYPEQILVDEGVELPLVWVHYTASGAFAEENPEVLERFQEAIEEANVWIDENPEAALEVYAEWMGTDVESVQGITMPARKVNVTVADFEPWITLMDAGGLLAGPVKAEDLIPSVFAK